MGLDLIVEGCAKPGHEAEWRRLLEASFAGQELSESDVARLQGISVPGHERIDAPRVGFDAAAAAWIVEARQAKTPEEIRTVLEQFHGYRVLRLVKCDGVPEYTHAGLYDGVDETSFRGAFLNSCKDVLGELLLADAWNSKFPEAAASYGRALLAAADAKAAGPTRKPLRALLAHLRLVKPDAPFADQLDIVRAAGRWYVFWGERGHAIRAWF